MSADGHDIGGHTLDHVNLTLQTEAEMRRQICDDRFNLFNYGLMPVSFSYPFGITNELVKRVTRECGYNSGRVGGGGVETLPPSDFFAIKTGLVVKNTTTLEMLQNSVSQAEAAGGGWLVLMFHDVVESNGGLYSCTPALLAAFLDWLETREVHGTVVRTVAEVIGGSFTPPAFSARTATPTATATPTTTPIATPTATTMATVTLTVTPTATPSATPTATATPTVMPTITSTATSSATGARLYLPCLFR